MAAPSDNISDRVIGLIDQASVTYIADTFNALWAAINVSFRGLLVLAIILYGLALWRGLIKTPVQELVGYLIKLTIIYALVSTWGIFSVFIVDFLTNTPDALAGVVSGGDGATASGVVGDVYTLSLAAAQEAYSQSGIVGPFVVGTLILFSGTLMMIYALFLIALSKIALSVLIGLGPLFLIALMFKPTAKLFEAWLQQIVNYILVTVLTVGVLGIMGRIAMQAAQTIPPDDITTGSVIPFVIVTFVTFLLLTQVLSIAGALGGGIGLTTNYFFAGATAGLGKAGGAGISGLGALGVKGGSAIKRRWSAGRVTRK